MIWSKVLSDNTLRISSWQSSYMPISIPLRIFTLLPRMSCTLVISACCCATSNYSGTVSANEAFIGGM